MNSSIQKICSTSKTKWANGRHTDTKVFEEFIVKGGLNQGSPLSTVLFNIVEGVTLRGNGVRTKGLMYGSGYQSLNYVDDMILMVRSKK